MRDDVAHPTRCIGRDADHVDDGQKRDREEQVRAWPGRDHGQSLPRALAPVGVGAERVRELAQAAVGGSPRIRRERSVHNRPLEVAERGASTLEVVLGDAALHPLDLRKQSR